MSAAMSQNPADKSSPAPARSSRRREKPQKAARALELRSRVRARVAAPLVRAAAPPPKRKVTRVGSWQPAYLAALAEVGYYAAACKAAGVSRSTAWLERQNNPAFAEAEKKARGAADMLLVDEALRRAREGVRRLKFNAKTGEPFLDPATGQPYVEHEYSDQLLTKLLSAHLPEVYREKLEHSGTLQHAHLTLEDLQMRRVDAEA